jgi:thiamine biosynthesis protein ThiS
MNLVINGEQRSMDLARPTLAAALNQLRVPFERTAVELNGQVVERMEYDSVVLKENDRLEIVTFVGGG